MSNRRKHDVGRFGLALQNSAAAAASYVYGVKAQLQLPDPDQKAQLAADEVHAQRDAIRRERPIRIIVVTLLAAIFLLYLPKEVVVFWLGSVILCDLLEARLFALVEETKDGQRLYRRAIFAVYLNEFCYSIPSALIWQLEDMFCKAISVGVMAAALMRLSTIRSIHPATGYAGTAAIATLISLSNSYYWLHLGDYRGFAFTSVIAIVSIGYVAAAITENHRQQQQVALGRMAVQRASEAKSHFLSQMSHELRTPLNAIIGIGLAAHRSVPDPEVKEQLGILVQSAKGLSMVLDDVLDLSAIEEGRITLRARLADPREEIGLAVALFRLQAEATGIDLAVRFDPDLPRSARLDFDRLRQCISNLISNALKHTRAGQVVLRAAFEAPDLLRVVVEDTGIGIPPGYEEAIFNRYERATKSTQGYGLGLTICRAIARRMGGDVIAVPRTTGAAFHLWVRCEATSDVAVIRPEIVIPPEIRGRTILIVDDIGTNRMVAASYLGLLQCHAIEASSGSEALAILEARPDIDLVLLDINMPQMDGLETLQSIRKFSSDSEGPPVIAMTADASDRERRIYLEAGMDGYVAKPIDLEALNAEITRLILLNYGAASRVPNAE